MTRSHRFARSAYSALQRRIAVPEDEASLIWLKMARREPCPRPAWVREAKELAVSFETTLPTLLFVGFRR